MMTYSDAATGPNAGVAAPDSGPVAPRWQRVLASPHLVWLAVAALVVLRIPYYGKILLDDPFITFRYAENLLAHGQFVFNVGEQVLATTTPVYALIMALFGAVGLPIPAAASLFNLLCEALLLAVLYRIVRAFGLGGWQTGLAFLVTALLTINDRSLSVASWGGMETAFSALLLYGTILLILQRRYSWAAIAGAVATLTRPDGIFVLMVLAGTVVVRERRVPWREVLIALVIGLPWVVYATATYGSFVSQSVSAKNAILPIWDNSVPTKLSILLYWPLRWFGLFAVLPLAFGVYRAFRPQRNPAALIVLAFGLIQLVYLFLPINPGFDWYFVPALIAGYLLVGAGLARLMLERRWLGLICGLGLLAGVAFTSVGNAISVASLDRDWRQGMVRVIDYLNEVAEPGDTVQSTNIGILGYGVPLRVLDPLGLASPEVLPYFDESQSIEDLTHRVAAAFQPEYVVSFGDPDYPGYTVAAEFPVSVLSLFVLERAAP